MSSSHNEADCHHFRHVPCRLSPIAEVKVCYRVQHHVNVLLQEVLSTHPEEDAFNDGATCSMYKDIGPEVCSLCSYKIQSMHRPPEGSGIAYVFRQTRDYLFDRWPQQLVTWNRSFVLDSMCSASCLDCASGTCSALSPCICWPRLASIACQAASNGSCSSVLSRGRGRPEARHGRQLHENPGVMLVRLLRASRPSPHTLREPGTYQCHGQSSHAFLRKEES